jgi:hypothetical protein
MEELIFILRALINDLDCVKYTDEQLISLLTTASFLVIGETPFIDDYVVNLTYKSISPDPTYANSADVPFMTLVSLKAAYLLLNSEAKISTTYNMKVVDGPSSIDLKDQWKAISTIAELRKKEYDQVKLQLSLEYGGGSGLAITTPTTVDYIMDGWR